MKLKVLTLTMALFVPLMSCRTTDSNLQDLDNTATSGDIKINQCGKTFEEGSDDHTARYSQYDLWMDGMTKEQADKRNAEKAQELGRALKPEEFYSPYAPLIVFDRNNKKLEAEISETLNAIPMNLLMAFFYSGGKLDVGPNNEDVCRSKLGRVNQAYEQQDILFAYESNAPRVPMSARTANIDGKITPTDSGPGGQMPIHSCWGTSPGQSGASILISDRMKDGVATSVRHGTLRMFGLLLSKLVANTYIENSEITEESVENGDKTLDAKVGTEDLKTTRLEAELDPDAKTLTIGNSSQAGKGRVIKVPANRDFLNKLNGMFNDLADDVAGFGVTQGEDVAKQFDLSKYAEWMVPATAEQQAEIDQVGRFVPRHAAKDYEGILNHMAFAEAFDSFYCNETTNNSMAKYGATAKTFSDIDRELSKIDTGDQTGKLMDSSAYLVASAGGWHGDIYYGVFGENLNMSNGIKTGPQVALFFGFFRAVFRGFVRAVGFVFRAAVRVARFAVRTVAYAARFVGRVVVGAARIVGRTIVRAGQAIAYTAGAVVGAATGWGAYRRHIGRGAGPLARAFIVGANRFAWRSHLYRRI